MSDLIEEECFADYKDGASYYPVQIRDLFNDCYLVLDKRGFGISSTVRLVRDNL